MTPALSEFAKAQRGLKQFLHVLRRWWMTIVVLVAVALGVAVQGFTSPSGAMLQADGVFVRA